MSLSNKEVYELATKHGLNLQVDTLKANESGLDFQVVFATDVSNLDWVLRIPRRQDVLPSVEKEKQILELVAPNISAQVPVWEVFSNELIGYRLLKGKPAGEIDIEAQAYVWQIDHENIPESFQYTLAQAMVSLHKINEEAARQAGLKILKPEELKASVKERMERVKEQFGVGEELWSRWQAWLVNETNWPKQTVLVHGDLHAGHILVDDQAQVTGLIDWTEARIDDPAHDFGVYLSIFGAEALKELIRSYQEAGGYVWSGMYQHIVELVSTYPINIAEFAMKSGLKEYEDIARQQLGTSQ